MTDGGESAPKKSEKRLNCWKEIAAFLQKDVRTVQRWEKNERLPVHRKPHDKLSSVYAYESELEAWWNQGSHPLPTTGTASRTAKSASSRIALAVLPLRNLSGDPAQEYFSDGLTEELIGQLARIDPDHLGIIAGASAMKYKQSSKGISQIARELGVTYLLEGTFAAMVIAYEFQPRSSGHQIRPAFGPMSMITICATFLSSRRKLPKRLPGRLR